MFFFCILFFFAATTLSASDTSTQEISLDVQILRSEIHIKAIKHIGVLKNDDFDFIAQEILGRELTSYRDAYIFLRTLSLAIETLNTQESSIFLTPDEDSLAPTVLTFEQELYFRNKVQRILSFHEARLCRKLASKIKEEEKEAILFILGYLREIKKNLLT